MKPITFWQRVGRAVRDRSFIIGSILVILFLLAAVLGPELAPRNPYTRDRIQTIDGAMQRAPFPPSWRYPLGTDTEGRDLFSLLLHGARQTLLIAFVAMTIRMLLGLVLGTVCGWWPGGPFDRAVTAVTEAMAAIPTLVLAMLLVYAVGIRRGQTSFIVAVSLVGWGEVTQIVRGHVVGIRSKLYISAARAVGLSSPEILSRHVLPNLLSTLLALAALEMAGVLLLLGELGFINVFIGGGGMYVDDALERTVHYYDVPDWGAMLGTSWRFFRSQPWLPLAPALSFLVAILGFNLFGYGLQRFVEKGRFHPSGWSLLRFSAVVGVLLFGAPTLLANTGPEAQFVAMAHQFDVQRAWNDILYLAQPKLEGRPPGPGPGHRAAGYIASQFQQAGLTPLPDGTYFQPYTLSLGEVVAPPVLEVLGEDGEPVLRLEDEVSFDPSVAFAAYSEKHDLHSYFGEPGAFEEYEAPSYVENQVSGDLEEDEVSFEENDTTFGPLLGPSPGHFAEDMQDVLSLGRLVALDPEAVQQVMQVMGGGVFKAEGDGVWQAELVVVSDMNSAPRSGLVLLLDPTEYDVRYMGAYSPPLGIIRLAPDAEIAAHDLAPVYPDAMGALRRYPHLLISESGARQLLALAGLDLDQLQADRQDGQRIVLHTGLQVRVTAGLIYHAVPAANVVGYFPAADMTTQGERILVAASYTGPFAPEGTVYPGADEDASAVAVMLEVARLWHDIGFQPKYTVIFAALDSHGGQYLINPPILPAEATDTWTMVMIHGIGAGDRRLARLPATSGSLARGFDSSARRMGVHTTELQQWRFPFESMTGWQASSGYRGLAVTRPGDERSGTPADTPDHLDPQLVAEAGWTLAHYLMALSSR